MDGVVGVDGFSVDFKNGTFAGGFDQGPVAVFGLAQTALGASAVMFNPTALKNQVAEKYEQGDGNLAVGNQQFFGKARHFGLNIVNVNSGADNPAPFRDA